MKDTAYDIYLNGKGYILHRSGTTKGSENRNGPSWQAATVGASIAAVSEADARYGNQSAVVELPVVWRGVPLGYGDRDEKNEGRYHWGYNIDARFPDMILPGPYVTTVTTGGTATVTRFADFDGYLWILAGRYIKVVTPATDVLAAAADAGSGKVFSDLGSFNGNLYALAGLSDNLQKHADGAAVNSWTEASSPAIKRNYMVVVKDRAFASDTAASVASVSDDLATGTWSASYVIGDPGTAIMGLGCLDELLYVGKEDGLHALDSSGIAPALTPELRPFAVNGNCSCVLPWHGSIWVNSIRGLLRYDNMGTTGFSVASCGPGRNVVSDNPVRGFVTALAGDDRWLYAALWTGDVDSTTGGDTYIVAGRETLSEEQSYGAMIWHPLVKLTAKRCNALHISGLWDSPRLWMGYGADAAYIILPRYADNPIADSACRYATSGSIYFSRHNLGSPNTTKVFKSLEIEADNLSDKRYVTAYYRVDNGSWQSIGRASLSPRTSLNFSAAGVAGKSIEIRLDYGLDSNANPIVIRSAVVRAAERPSVVDNIIMEIRCADNLKTRYGGVCDRNGATLLADLKALAKSSAAVYLSDLFGELRRVLVVPPVKEQALYQWDTQTPEILATVYLCGFDTAEETYEEFLFSLGYGPNSWEIPWAIPWVLGSGASINTTAILAYEGTAPSKPVIVLTGPLEDPVLTNVTTGRHIGFSSHIGATDVYTIDCGSGTAVDKTGADVSSNLTAGSDVANFVLVTGDNELTLTGAGATATTAAKILYIPRDAV